MSGRRKTKRPTQQGGAVTHRPSTYLEDARPPLQAGPRQVELFPGAIRLEEFSFEMTRGPLPPPTLLAEYEHTLPGLGERIARMAETEATHRHRMEHGLLRLSYLGVSGALAIALMAIGGGIYAIIGGQSAYGLAAIVTALAGLVTVFVLGRRDAPPQDTVTEKPLAG